MSRSIHGLLPVLQTPFTIDEQIDWDVLSREIEWVLDQGADGLVLAMVSEVLRLDESERRALIERVCQLVPGRVPVVASVGAESSVVAQSLARYAEDCGAAAVMAIPPIATACPESELEHYYKRLIESISIPVIVQDASGYVGRPMSIELQASLFQTYGQRVMFKPEAHPLGPRLTLLRNATDKRAAIFEGSGGVALMESHARGIAGTMPGCDLLRITGPLYRALESGDDQHAWQLAAAVAPLLSMQNTLDSFLAIEKHLLVRQGVFDNTVVRGPVGYIMDDITRAEVDRLFDRALAVAETTETVSP